MASTFLAFLADIALIEREVNKIHTTPSNSYLHPHIL